MEAATQAEAQSVMPALAGFVLKRWKILAALFLIGAAAGLAMAFNTPKQYQAETVFVVNGTSQNNLLQAALGSLGSLSSLVGVSQDSGTDEALTVMRSPEFTWDFCSENQVFPVLFPQKWDASKGSWRMDVEPPSKSEVKDVFDKSIRFVTLDRRTNQVTLQFRTSDPARSANWANATALKLDAVLRRAALEKSRARVSFLQKQLAANTIVEVRESVSRLLEAELQRQMLASADQSYSINVLQVAFPGSSRSHVWPRKSLFMMIGAAIGLVLALIWCLAVFMREGRIAVSRP